MEAAGLIVLVRLIVGETVRDKLLLDVTEGLDVIDIVSEGLGLIDVVIDVVEEAVGLKDPVTVTVGAAETLGVLVGVGEGGYTKVTIPATPDPTIE